MQHAEMSVGYAHADARANARGSAEVERAAV